MSRTNKGGKPIGYEFNQARPCSGWLGSEAKRITHKKERARSKRLSASEDDAGQRRHR